MHLYINFFKTQKLVSIISFIYLLVAIVMNIFISQVKESVDFVQLIVNLSSIILYMALCICAYFINHNIMRIFQCIMYLSVGCITILFDNKTYFIGEVLAIIGILLLYAYNYIKFNSISIAISLISLVAIRLFSIYIVQKTDVYSGIIVSIFSMTLLILLFSIVGDHINIFTDELKKYENFSRIGQDEIGLLHSLNIQELITSIYNIKLRIKDNEIERAQERLDAHLEILQYVEGKYQSLRNVVILYNQKEMVEAEVHETINKAIAFEKLSSAVEKKITFILNYTSSKYYINQKILNELELFLIFQNIIRNAINSIFKKNKSGIITVNTNIIGNDLKIIFIDTGGGFNKNFNLDGFGLYYVTNMLKRNNAKIEIANNTDNGAIVTIILAKGRIING